MKQFLKLCSVLAVTGSLFAGCAEPPTAVERPDFQMGNGKGPGGGGGGGVGTSAPELTFTSRIWAKGKNTYQLNVMNVDGTNQAAIYRAPSTAVTLSGSPSWSADGNSIAFTQLGNGGTIPDTIKVIDVSVNSSGQAVGTNLRTLAVSPASGVRLKNPFWSSANSGLIAFTTDDGATSNSLWTVPASGGIPTLITTISKAWAGHSNPLGVPTWNSDDSKLAMIRIGAGNTTIMIFNTSDWSYVDSMTVAGSIFGMEWSRSGENKLAFSANNIIQYIDPVTGASPTTNNVAGQYPAWAPDNSSLMIVSSGDLYNCATGTSNNSVVVAGSFAAVKWK